MRFRHWSAIPGRVDLPVGETRAMGRRLLALLGLVLALVVVAPAAADDPSDDKAAVDARIAALQADIAQSKAR